MSQFSFSFFIPCIKPHVQSLSKPRVGDLEFAVINSTFIKLIIHSYCLNFNQPAHILLFVATKNQTFAIFISFISFSKNLLTNFSIYSMRNLIKFILISRHRKMRGIVACDAYWRSEISNNFSSKSSLRLICPDLPFLGQAQNEDAKIIQL